MRLFFCFFFFFFLIVFSFRELTIYNVSNKIEKYSEKNNISLKYDSIEYNIFNNNIVFKNLFVDQILIENLTFNHFYFNQFYDININNASIPTNLIINNFNLYNTKNFLLKTILEEKNNIKFNLKLKKSKFNQDKSFSFYLDLELNELFSVNINLSGFNLPFEEFYKKKSIDFGKISSILIKPSSISIQTEGIIELFKNKIEKNLNEEQKKEMYSYFILSKDTSNFLNDIKINIIKALQNNKNIYIESSITKEITILEIINGIKELYYRQDKNLSYIGINIKSYLF